MELLAGWLSLVLVGRILFVAGIRDGLRKSGAETLLADFALGAMAVSVILEIGAFAVAGGAVQALSKGADQSTIVGIDAAAKWLDMVIVTHSAYRHGGWGDHGSGVWRRWCFLPGCPDTLVRRAGGLGLDDRHWHSPASSGRPEIVTPRGVQGINRRLLG